MKLNRIAAPALAALLGLTALATAHAVGAPHASPTPGAAQDRDHDRDRDWNLPPREFNDIQRRGFQDGLVGAQKDFDNHRRPDVDNRDEYRHPDMPHQMWDAYQEGFRRGYSVGVSHLTQQPVYAPPPPPMHDHDADRGDHDHDRWDAIPNEFSEIKRRGFQDGMDGARKDMENHRRPDPDNRDEFRNPRVPRELREDYREGFRRGYQLAVDHMMGDHDRH